MARLTDHDTRDAEDALRKELSLIFGRYVRRMLSEGKAHIVEGIAEASKEEGEIDGIAIGRAAAARVTAKYFAVAKPKAAIEASAATTTELSPATDTDSGDTDSGDR
jgi:hypothetical protein